MEQAIKSKNVAEFRRLFTTSNQTIGNKTLLYLACENDSLEIVQELLKHPKIDVNNGLEYELEEYYFLRLEVFSPLFVACSKNYVEIVRELLKHPKIDVNKGLEVVKEYLEREELVEEREKFRYLKKESPLFVACSKNYVEIVRELLKHPKIDVKKINFVNWEEMTAVEIAKEKGYKNIEALFKIEVLLGEINEKKRIIDEQMNKMRRMEIEGKKMNELLEEQNRKDLESDRLIESQRKKMREMKVEKEKELSELSVKNKKEIRKLLDDNEKRLNELSLQNKEKMKELLEENKKKDLQLSQQERMIAKRNRVLLFELFEMKKKNISLTESSSRKNEMIEVLWEIFNSNEQPNFREFENHLKKIEEFFNISSSSQKKEDEKEFNGFIVGLKELMISFESKQSKVMNEVDAILEHISTIENEFCEKRIKEMIKFHKKSEEEIKKQMKIFEETSNEKKEFDQISKLRCNRTLSRIKKEIQKQFSIGVILKDYEQHSSPLIQLLQHHSFPPTVSSDLERILNLLKERIPQKLRRIVKMIEKSVQSTYLLRISEFIDIVKRSKTMKRELENVQELKADLKKKKKELRKKTHSFEDKDDDDEWISEKQRKEEKKVIEKMKKEMNSFQKEKEESERMICSIFYKQQESKKKLIFTFVFDLIGEYIKNEEEFSKKRSSNDSFNEFIHLLKRKGVFSNNSFKKDYKVIETILPDSLYVVKPKTGYDCDQSKVIKRFEYNSTIEEQVRNEIINQARMKSNCVMKINKVFVKGNGSEGTIGYIYYEMDYYFHDLLSWMKGTKRKVFTDEEEFMKVLCSPNEVSRDLILHVFQSILKGILFVHHSQIEHRDIKPMNILMNDMNDVKISDFGISKDSRVTATATSLRNIQGTKRYLPPEKKLSKEGDMYAFGLMLFESLYPQFAGCHEKGKNVLSVVEEEVKNEIEKDVLKGLLNVNPSLRYSAEQTLEHEFFKTFVFHEKREGEVLVKDEEKMKKLVDEHLFPLFSKYRKEENDKREFFDLILDRKGDIMESFKELFQKNVQTMNELCRQIKVRFIREETAYGKGLTEEAFSLLFEQMSRSNNQPKQQQPQKEEEEEEGENEEEVNEHPYLFDVCGCYFFPTDQWNQQESFYEFGKILCRCLLEKRIAGINLSPSVWYFVLHGYEPSSFDVLRELLNIVDPDQLLILMNTFQSDMNLEDILDDDENEGIEKNEKLKFVKKEIRSSLFGSVFRRVNLTAFRKGFFSCLKDVDLSIRGKICELNYKELSGLMYGKGGKFCSAEELLQNITYSFHEGIDQEKCDQMKQFFKKWIEEDASDVERIQFIRFVTGKNGLNIDGFLYSEGKRKNMKIVVGEDFQDPLNSHTCFFQLDVNPNHFFNDYSKLKEMLDQGIKSCEMRD